MNLSNENVIHVKKGNCEYIQFRKLLEYGIKHAYGLKPAFYNTKKDIVSKETYNKSIENYKVLCDNIGVDYNNLIKPYQSHTDIVKCVNSLTGEMSIQDKYIDVDGLITNIDGAVLVTTNADCILLLLYDPVNNVIGNVHSGWKGTFKKIAINAINEMINKYNSNPQNIIACICPSIRKCHFEVKQDVKDMCEEIFSYTNRLDEIIEYIGKDKDNKDAWLVDTVLINKIMLMDCGLEEENIIDSGICSVCNSELVHSYRVEGSGYGLCSAIIAK